MLYLDYAASTPTLPEVIKEMAPYFSEFYGNPSASHSMGASSLEAIEKSREIIAEKIGAYPSEVIFTSGATEANNIAIKGLAYANREKGNHIVTSSTEHKCVLNICAHLEKKGFEVTYLKPDKEGIITAEEVSRAITEETILVSIMHVNNELGTINPIQAIGQLCFENDIHFHSDTAQSFCKLEIDVLEMNLDAISVSAHKFGGPKGIGFVYIRDARNCHIEPIIHGAGQENGLRGGTLPTPLIVGLGAAIKHFVYNSVLLEAVRQRFIDTLAKNGFEFSINGSQGLPHIVSITFHSEQVVSYLESLPYVAISRGSACNSKNIEPSHVLSAIGIPFELAYKTFRLSFYENDISSLFEDYPTYLRDASSVK